MRIAACRIAAKIEGLVAPHYMGPGIVSPHMREHYDDRWVESATGSPHDTKTLSDSQKEFLGAPRHLLARPHPVTSETALYCPCATSRGIEGMGDDEARALLTELTDHALSPAYRCKK